MPICTVDAKSGAVQYTPTQSEREMLDLKRTVKQLMKRVEQLEERIEELEAKTESE